METPVAAASPVFTRVWTTVTTCPTEAVAGADVRTAARAARRRRSTVRVAAAVMDPKVASVPVAVPVKDAAADPVTENVQR